MGAKLEDLAAGLHGNVTRADAKGLAKLHGHRWFDLRREMLKVDGEAFQNDPAQAISDEKVVHLTVLPMVPAGLRALVQDWIERGWLSDS